MEFMYFIDDKCAITDIAANQGSQELLVRLLWAYEVTGFRENDSSFMSARISNDVYEAQYQLPIDEYNHPNPKNINCIICNYNINHNINAGAPIVVVTHQ